jgi:hypothetical protein
MQITRIVLPMVCTLAAGCAGQNKSDATLTKELTRMAGQTAVACGLVEGAARFDAAWKCAKANDSTGNPFWLALREFSVDVDAWQAIARTSTGERYTIFYTSNNNGGLTFEPYFHAQKCSQPFSYQQGLLVCGESAP